MSSTDLNLNRKPIDRRNTAYTIEQVKQYVIKYAGYEVAELGLLEIPAYCQYRPYAERLTITGYTLRENAPYVIMGNFDRSKNFNICAPQIDYDLSNTFYVIEQRSLWDGNWNCIENLIIKDNNKKEIAELIKQLEL